MTPRLRVLRAAGRKKWVRAHPADGALTREWMVPIHKPGNARQTAASLSVYLTSMDEILSLNPPRFDTSFVINLLAPPAFACS